MASFPSPCGEKVGINGGGVLSPELAGAADVSVPLRGKGRDQRGFSNLTVKPPPLVSVPLRGKGRDQQKKPEPILLGRHLIKFPSPCGEKVGINL